MPQTTELAFEAHVEEMLLRRSGWERGPLDEWDVERALFPAQVCAYLERTQDRLWAQMRALHGAALEVMIVDALAKEPDLKGTIHVLHYGFKF